MIKCFSKQITFIILCFNLLFGISCISKKPDCILNEQNAASLTAIRYIEIIKAINSNETDSVVKDMDWWIDQAIIGLEYLDQEHPDKRLGEVKIHGSSLKMTRVYRNIARYRNEHPRVHIIPLEKEQLELINNFVEKYK